MKEDIFLDNYPDTCEECALADNCPVYYHKNNAACLMILDYIAKKKQNENHK